MDLKLRDGRVPLGKQLSGIVVRKNEASAICAGKQEMVVMPMQCRTLQKGESMYLLVHQGDVSSNEFSGQCSDVSHHYKVVAVLQFEANRRMTPEKLMAAGQANALPSNEEELKQTRQDLNLKPELKQYLLWQFNNVAPVLVPLCVKSYTSAMPSTAPNMAESSKEDLGPRWVNFMVDEEGKCFDAAPHGTPCLAKQGVPGNMEDLPASQQSAMSIGRELSELVRAHGDEDSQDTAGLFGSPAHSDKAKVMTAAKSRPQPQPQPEKQTSAWAEAVPTPCQVDHDPAKASQNAEAKEMIPPAGSGSAPAVPPEIKIEQADQGQSEVQENVAAVKAVSVQEEKVIDPVSASSGSTASAASASQELPSSFQIDPHRNRKVVTTMAESFMFEQDCLETILEEDGEEKVLSIYDAMCEDTMSTAFSGIEAASTAANMLRQAWSARLGVPFQRQPMTFMIEWNQQCINELLPMAQKHGICLFTNVASFYSDELKPTIDDLMQNPSMAVEVLAPVLSANKAMKLSAFCATHGKECTIHSSARHIAGTSCKPWSRKGANMGQADPEMLFTLAWIGLMIALQCGEIISENVKTQGSSSSCSDNPASVQDAGLGNLLLRFLSPFYFMERVVLSPKMLGDPFQREREFVKMVHRMKAPEVISPLSRFCKRFFRICQWSWKSAWFLHFDALRGKGIFVNELEDEIRWACGRPTSRARAMSEEAEKEGTEIELTFEEALNEMEYSFLQQYRKSWPGGVYQLNQDPQSGHGHHSTDEFSLFTLISNFGLVWSDHAKRWLMPTEALICQHYPVLPVLHDTQLELCTFHMKNEKRSGRHIFGQVGNSMHVGVMALLQLHSLSEVRHQRVPELFKNIRLARCAARESYKKRIRETATPPRRIREKSRLSDVYGIEGLDLD